MHFRQLLRSSIAVLLALAIPNPSRTQDSLYLVRDINPGPRYSYPIFFTASNGRLFFWGDGGSPGSEVWVSDGTGEGTHMVRDIGPGPISQSRSPLVDAGGIVYFRAYSTFTGEELWRTDGSEEGTVLVRDIAPGHSSSIPGDITAVGDTVYFTAYLPETGLELWLSEGSPESTRPVGDLLPGPGGSYPIELTAFRGELFFFARDDSEIRQLWKTDGTGPGTKRLTSSDPGSPFGLTAAADRLFYIWDATQLWTSAGTRGTTRRIDLPFEPWGPWTFGGHVPNFRAVPWGIAFTAATPDEGWELWKSDGTERGTTVVRDINPGPASGFPLGHRPEPFADGNILYFPADDGIHGIELWKSDGTESGTVLVRDIVPGPEGSYPGKFTSAGGRIYFSTMSRAAEVSVWSTDGTPEGTVRAVEPFVIPAEYHGGYHLEFLGVGDLVFLDNHDSARGRELWAIRTSGPVVTGVADSPPPEFSLRQNYPNPFNPSTSITWSISRTGHVRLLIYNTLGEVVATLVNSILPPGVHTTEFSPAGLPTGVYFCRLSSDGDLATRKMLLLR